MRIAVLAVSRAQYDTFLQLIEPEDHGMFVPLLHESDVRRETFDAIIRVGNWRDIPNAEAVLCAVKERCK